MNGELAFDFTQDEHGPEAEKMVRDCIRFYGGAFTGYNLTFGLP